jgi:hypothetical protein
VTRALALVTVLGVLAGAVIAYLVRHLDLAGMTG